MTSGLALPFPFAARRLRGLAALALSVALLLSGCAAQRAWRDGQQLIEQDRVEEGLSEMQRAIQASPEVTEYRKGYIVARERATANWLIEADRALKADQLDQADRLYRRVLDVHPGNDLARQGLRSVRVQAEVTRSLSEARQAMAAQEDERARLLLQGVLNNDPGSEPAQALMRELNTRQPAASSESTLSAVYRQPISIEFRDVPIKQAFEVLSRSSGLNFVFDKDVKADQKTSIFLRNSTVESALYFLLLSNQLEQQVMNGNTLMIYPNTQTKLKDYQELSVRAFTMANTDVKSVAAAVKTLLKGRDVVVDEKLNMLVVRDTPEAIRQVEKIVALHDVPEPEVMLEVEILEVTRSTLQELGIRWPDSLSLTPLASDEGVGLTLDDLRHLKAGKLGANLNSTKINVRGEGGNVNLLANPRIRVLNKEKAKVLIGDRVPNIVVTTTPQGGFAESVNYIDVGLKLDVEPTIYRGNDVLIRIGLEVSNIAGSQTTKLGTVAYTFGTRNASTTLRLKDGENQVLAGLINDEDRRTSAKIPGMGELPVVGRLFGTSNDETKKSEIVLSITPRLVRNVQRQLGQPREFRSGTDNSLRERPDAPSTPVSASPAVQGTASLVSQTPLVVALPPLPAESAERPTSAAPAPAPASASASASAFASASWLAKVAGKSTAARIDEDEDVRER